MMLTKVVLNVKRDEKGEACKRKDRLVVCGYEEVNCQEETFFSVDGYFVIKLIFSFCIQQERTARHTGFENAFSNRRLERPVYVGMYAGVLSKLEHWRKVFWLSGNRSGMFVKYGNVQVAASTHS